RTENARFGRGTPGYDPCIPPIDTPVRHAPDWIARRYRLLEPIGRGAMGEVWSAQDLVLERKVAVKLGTGDHRGDVLLREARLAPAGSHPQLIGVLDAGQEGGRSCVVMELVEGVTLAERLRAGRIDAGEARTIALQAARGL